MLVHHGHSVHSGHYVCYVKASNGMWHICDDTRVGQVGERTVLGQQAYILFYVRRHPKHGGAAAQRAAADAATGAAARSREQLQASSVHSAGGASAGGVASQQASGASKAGPQQLAAGGKRQRALQEGGEELQLKRPEGPAAPVSSNKGSTGTETGQWGAAPAAGLGARAGVVAWAGAGWRGRWPLQHSRMHRARVPALLRPLHQGEAVRTRDWLKGCIETPRGPFPPSGVAGS